MKKDFEWFTDSPVDDGSVTPPQLEESGNSGLIGLKGKNIKRTDTYSFFANSRAAREIAAREAVAQIAASEKPAAPANILARITPEYKC